MAAWLGGVWGLANLNSFLKVYWMELNQYEDDTASHQRSRNMVDQILMFINPQGFEALTKQRDVPSILTPEEYMAARGSMPPPALTIPVGKSHV